MTRISRGTAGAAALGMAVMIVGGAAFAQRARLPAECREALMAQCGQASDRRACIRAALANLNDECRKAVSDRAATAQPLPPGMREVSYGSDPKQTLDYVRPAGTTTAPILLFVHGGGWSIGDKRHSIGSKASHFTGQGWAVASANYRLVPHATVEQQAADVAAAIGWLRANAAANDLDPQRIVLMGHSAGAHLVALVGTDPRYLKTAGVPLSAVKGVILLDGAGYDVPAQMTAPGNRVQSMFNAAFGKDVTRQKALSPTFHAAAPNVANWLILPVERRADSRAQSKVLAAGLSRAGASTLVVAVPGESHGSLNKGLGEAGDFATGEVDRFLAALR